MPNLISCRPESFGKYHSRAFEALPDLGIVHVEIPAPAPEAVVSTRANLEKYGLRAASVTMGAKIQQDDFLDRVSRTVDSASALEAPVIFTSQKAGEMDRARAYELLRQAGDIAQKKDVYICLETHPDLGTNSRVMMETIKGVEHPYVRINFDPANIHYYNEGVNAIEELRPVLNFVRAVHLKDTNGGYQAHHFPAIGEGVVDWKTLFALLNGLGFAGPFTLEMEGIAGEDLSYEQTADRIRKSVEFLRESGLMA